MSFDFEKAREDFDFFLNCMEDKIAWLESEADQVGMSLDFSHEAPERLEELFSVLAGDLDDEDKSMMIVAFARYLGEFVRRTYGGRWELPLDDEMNLNFNMPVIVGYSTVEALEFSPIWIMRAYSIRGVQGMIRRAIANHIDPQEIDFSQETEAEERMNGPD